MWKMREICRKRAVAANRTRYSPFPCIMRINAFFILFFDRILLTKYILWFILLLYYRQ